MKRLLTALFGTLCLLGAIALALRGVTAPATDPLLVTGIVLLVVLGAVGMLVKVAGPRGDGGAVAQAPWRPGGMILEDAPERSPADVILSGEGLADVVASAGERAREEGTVSAGLAVVRPALRTALVDALVRGGADREDAERSVETGSWTGDATAAAVLDEDVDHPGWSLRGRFEAWLFPERVVRREVRRAMGAVAAAAEDALPTVPGQRAPRTVRVLQPTLEDLRRGADGHLQRAADPLGARRGSAVDADVTVRDGAAVGEPRASTDPEDETETADREAGDASGEASDASNDAGQSRRAPGPRVDAGLLEREAEGSK